MAQRFGVKNGKEIRVPMLPREILTKEQSPFMLTKFDQMKDVPYLEAIGCSMAGYDFAPRCTVRS